MPPTSSPQLLKIPPQSIEAEQALLGAVMLRPDSLYEVVGVLTPAVFYVERHRVIFEAMLSLFSKNEPLDLLSLSNRLKEHGRLEAVGGASYLSELINTVPSSLNAAYYAGIIKHKFLMRKLIEASEHISHLGYSEAEELEEVLDKAEKTVFDVTNLSSYHKLLELKEALGEAWDRLEKLHTNKEGLRGVPTGFPELDTKLAGLQKADLIILAARPSMGKTSLALDIARQTATLHNTQVCIFSLEMSAQQLVDRMLAAQSRVNAWRLRTGNLSTDEEFLQIRDALDTLSRAPIFIDDQPGNTILKMRSMTRRLKSEKGVGLVVVDYLQLMMPPQGKWSDSLVQQVTEISRSLKTLARELEVPVLALSQLSRAVEQRGGRPRLSDLRDSGSIEQDADVVMFIHREDKYKENSDKPNIAEILIEKHRNGPTGKVELYFDDKRATFMSVEKSEFSGTNSTTRESEEW